MPRPARRARSVLGTCAPQVLRCREQRAGRLVAPDCPVVPTADEPEAMADTGAGELGRESRVLHVERVRRAGVGPHIGSGRAQRPGDVRQRGERAVRREQRASAAEDALQIRRRS